MTLRNNLYITSKDYEELWNLALHTSVVCFVDDFNKVYFNKVSRDIARSCTYSKSVEISARGFTYISAEEKEDFKRQCINSNLEFIDPKTKEPVDETPTIKKFLASPSMISCSYVEKELSDRIDRLFASMHDVEISMEEYEKRITLCEAIVDAELEGIEKLEEIKMDDGNEKCMIKTVNGWFEKRTKNGIYFCKNISSAKIFNSSHEAVCACHELVGYNTTGIELVRLNKEDNFNPPGLSLAKAIRVVPEEKLLADIPEELKDLKNFISGKITHYVVLGYDPKIFEIGDMSCDHEPTKKRLLCLYGDSKGDLTWNLNRYSDGSGWDTEIWPVCSFEEGVAKLQKHIDKKADINKPDQGLVMLADKYKLDLPTGYREAVKEKEKTTILKKMGKLEDELKKLRETYEDNF